MVTKQTLFRPSRMESKADATTTAARSIIDSETSARDAKVARLRKARLDREAAEAEAPAEPPKKAARRGAARPKG